MQAEVPDTIAILRVRNHPGSAAPAPPPGPRRLLSGADRQAHGGPGFGEGGFTVIPYARTSRPCISTPWRDDVGLYSSVR